MDTILPQPLPGLLTTEERRQIGHDRRQSIPRSALGVWTPPSDRADPVQRIIDGDRTRLPDLLPEKYRRMSTDPFAFLRGTAGLMAADLGSMPDTGLRVQAGGDAHMDNFGAFESAEGTPVYDVNDFDETLPAPFEWDVRRLATSLVLFGRTRGAGDKPTRGFARRAAAAYRQHMRVLAAQTPLDAWRSRIDLEEAIEDIADRDVRKQERYRLHHVIEFGRTAYRSLLGRDGALHLPNRPPLVYRLDDHEDTAHAAFAACLATLPEERRILLDRYRLRDVAFKAVGVGSVGTFCAIGLFSTADGEPLLLQLKEAQHSVLAPFAGPSVYQNQGQRVVVGQRMMQATPDVFLGWAEAGPQGRQFYMRLLKDPHLAGLGERLDAGGLPYLARLCGRTLARAHARTGDAAAIGGYLGEGDAFDEAIAAFALAYADQVAADYALFREAIRAGRIPVAGNAG